MFTVGQIVYSKSGRDKGRVFIVVRADGGYAWLADGHMRRLDKPKKKKAMHIQPTKSVCGALSGLLESGRITDADVRKALKAYIVTGKEADNLV